VAHDRLGQAYVLQGDTNKARSYEDFFALSKDVDTDIPNLQHAKAEYAKLHSLPANQRSTVLLRLPLHRINLSRCLNPLPHDTNVLPQAVEQRLKRYWQRQMARSVFQLV
jgi:hypothetical protein